MTASHPISYSAPITLTESWIFYDSFNSLASTNVFRAESIEAVSSFIPENGNRDGDFIRYINNILEKSGAEHFTRPDQILPVIPELVAKIVDSIW